MRIHKQIILFFLLFVSVKCIACTCAIPKSLKAIQKYEFENSECIFIGEVLKIDKNKNTFEIKVIESFNGDEKGEIYNGIYDQQCGPIINEKGIWLIYGNYNADNLIDINSCGLTRSFNNPESNTSATRSPKPILLPDENLTQSQIEKRIAEWESKAKSDLKNEVAYLRRRIKI